MLCGDIEVTQYSVLSNGLRQRLGNSWTIDYYVRHQRDTSDGGCDLSVGISASLLAY